MTKTAIRPCPICGNRAADILHSQRFASIGQLPDGYDVLACKSCGFAYADTASTQESYDALYQDLASRYRDTKTSTGSGASAWDAERLAATAAAIGSFLNDPQTRILDIGCANGGLLEALRDLGYRNLAGLDPAAACAANTRSRGFAAYTGSLTTIPRDLPPFDVLILSHVLEHIRDLHPAFKGLRRLLREGSIVYIEVPDASRYHEFLNAPFQDFNSEHINHFSGLCLDNLTGQFGLAPLAPVKEKLIPSSADTLYPAIFGFYEYTGADQKMLVMDAGLRGNLGDYIARSSALMNATNNYLVRQLAECGEVVLWGAGQLATKLLNEEPLRTANIRACVDSNPVSQGKQLRGIPILSPTDLKGVNCPIVIMSTLHDADIRRNIQELGLTNRLISLREQIRGEEAGQ